MDESMLEYVTKRLGFLQPSGQKGKHEPSAERRPSASASGAAEARRAEEEAFLRELEEAFGAASAEPLEAEDTSGAVPEEPALPAGQEGYEEGLRLFQAGCLPEALEVLEQAAGQGHPEAQYLCGQLYRQKENGLKTALSWYKRAAKQGHREAQMACAAMYEKGQGTAIHMKRALSWYEQAAKGGLVEAQLKCGRMYYSGRAETRSPKKARYWLEAAAGNGSAEAEKLLAECF